MIGLGGHIRILSLYIVSIGQLCRKIIQKLEDEEFWKVFTMIVENNVEKNLNNVKIYKNSDFLPPTRILHVSTYIIQYELLSLGAAMEIWSA
jgi:hypothetical protein